MWISRYKIMLNCFILFSLDYKQRYRGWAVKNRGLFCTWYAKDRSYEYISNNDDENFDTDLEMYEESVEDNFNAGERMMIRRLFKS